MKPTSFGDCSTKIASWWLPDPSLLGNRGKVEGGLKTQLSSGRWLLRTGSRILNPNGLPSVCNVAPGPHSFIHSFNKPLLNSCSVPTPSWAGEPQEGQEPVPVLKEGPVCWTRWPQCSVRVLTAPGTAGTSGAQGGISERSRLSWVLEDKQKLARPTGRKGISGRGKSAHKGTEA